MQTTGEPLIGGTGAPAGGSVMLPRIQEPQWGAADTRFEISRDQVLREVDIDALRAALPSLTTVQRQAMLLTYVAGYTHLQVSGPLGIPLAAVKSWVLAALVALRHLHPGRGSARKCRRIDPRRSPTAPLRCT